MQAKLNNIGWEDELPYNDKNSKSFDDVSKYARKKRKISKVKCTTRQQIIIPQSEVKINGDRINKLQKKEAKDYLSSPLKNHKITSNQRSKMIDWMVEWFSIFNKRNESYFLSVYLFDMFLQNTSLILDDSDVHLIGITCIFIASKFWDIIPIFLTELWTKIGHNTFGPNIIKKSECEIMKTIDWNISIATPYSFLSYYIQAIRTRKHNISSHTTFKSISEKYSAPSPFEQWDQSSLKEALDSLEIVSLQYSKMAMINEEFLSYKPSVIALASLCNASKFIKETGYSWNKPNSGPWIHNINKACSNCEKFFFDSSLMSKDKVQLIYNCVDELLKAKGKLIWENVHKWANLMTQFMLSFEEKYQDCKSILKFSLMAN